jgi:hypothetical protein
LQPFQRITNADLPEMSATYYDSAAADKTVIDYPRADRLHRAWAGGEPVQHHRHHRRIRPCR